MSIIPSAAPNNTNPSALSPQREAEIVARLDDEDRTASELTDIVTELLAELDCVRARVAELEGDLNAGVNTAIRNAMEGSAVREARTAARAKALREAADDQDAKAATDVIRRRRNIATGRRLVAVDLRRMADEATTGGVS